MLNTSANCYVKTKLSDSSILGTPGLTNIHLMCKRNCTTINISRKKLAEA